MSELFSVNDFYYLCEDLKRQHDMVKTLNISFRHVCEFCLFCLLAV